MYKLLSNINKQCGEQKLEDNTLSSVFQKWWPDLEREVNDIIIKHESKVQEVIRSDREIMEEVLTLMRSLVQMKRDERGPEVWRHLLTRLGSVDEHDSCWPSPWTNQTRQESGLIMAMLKAMSRQQDKSPDTDKDESH